MRAPRIHAELRTIAMKALSGFTHRDSIRNSLEASVQPDEDQPIDVRLKVVTSSAGENAPSRQVAPLARAFFARIDLAFARGSNVAYCC